MKTIKSFNKHPLSKLFVTAAMISGFANLRAEVIQQGAVTRFVVPAETGLSQMDYAHAVPMELPRVPAGRIPKFHEGIMRAANAPRSAARPGFSPGARGNGQEDPIVLPKPEHQTTGGVAPQEFGTSNHPFTTARNDSPRTTNKSYPSRASGKLLVNTGSSTGECSASLIARGLVVTAAHCVAEFGSNEFYSAWQFKPGYRDGVAPYGIWEAADVFVLPSWLDGTDSCAVPEVVCEDDVAVLLVRAKRGAYPGTKTGWYAFGYDGYGFNADNSAQITQIGYPGCLDDGKYQERNDSFGYVNGDLSNNTIIGSLMCQGSSGGPWLVNFGIRPALTGTDPGAYSAPNVVVGVTSAGSTDPAPKIATASPFTSGNIRALVNAACAARPAACQ